MNKHITLVTKAARNLGLSINQLDKNGLFIEIANGKINFHFIHQQPPLNSATVVRICKDKEYTYNLLNSVISMPKTKGYLDPAVQEIYREYVEFENYDEIIKDIERNFNYPVILKRNSGSQGINVFECKDSNEAMLAMKEIYKRDYINYDYSLIAQDKINIKQEFRVVILNHKIEILYLKDNSNAIFNGNLSPLHWDNAKATLISDQNLLNRVQEFINPIFSKLDVRYGGIDIALDQDDMLWLIEVNSNPSFNLFIRDNGDEKIISLYTKMLKKLFKL